jgi:hypothetical protein
MREVSKFDDIPKLEIVNEVLLEFQNEEKIYFVISIVL